MPSRINRGIKRTAFYPVISRFNPEWKLYNHYLKPQQISDPLEEYWAMRRVAGLWDVSGEDAIVVEGPDAFDLLNLALPRDLGKLPDGRCFYSVLCYDYGGIIDDGVLCRFHREKFWWVTGEGNSEQWLWSHGLGRRVNVYSLRDRVHVASIQGPRSREILQRVCEVDLSRVPYFGLVPSTRVCGVPATISRTGFTAELGYDIYVAVEDAVPLYQGLWEAGRQDGIALCGSRALDIRRIEAAILNYTQDMDWTTNPYEVNLDWMVDLGKPVFHGREALARVKQEGVKRRLVGLRLEGELAAEPEDAVLRDGRPVGEVTSATFSPALEVSIALAMLEIAATEPGTRLEVELRGHAGRRVGAEVVPIPFLDPERRLARA